MGRFSHSANDAQQPPAVDSERLTELQAEIDAADSEHRRLLRVESSDYAHLRQVHLAGALVWTLRATKCFEEGNHDGARKASATANEQAAMANKLEQNSAMDRLAELERILTTARQDAQHLARLS